MQEIIEEIQGFITHMDSRNLRIRVGERNIRISHTLYKNVASHFKKGDHVRCGCTNGSVRSFVRVEGSSH